MGLTAAHYYRIKFEDNGIGFEQKYESKIFTLFQRLHLHEEYSGTGIGLALCKKIVENHGGFINATSELGKGATFNVYLPVEKVVKPI
jgi:chemotaxis family two-component system sensor kinase Cph1